MAGKFLDAEPERTGLQHFRLVRKGVDTAALRHELAVHATLWLAETGRQEKSPAQKDTNAIPLRGLRRSKIRGRRRRDVHESRYTSMAARFPATVQLLEGLATELGGELGRARLARLPPGKVVSPHIDRGEYYRLRDRYHLVIRSARGSLLQAGGEQVRMQEGELWWFDNSAVHDARNDSGEHRVHLIFDVLPAGGKAASSLGIRAPGQSTPRPDPLLQAFRAEAERLETESVAAAVHLYLAARSHPRQWQGILERQQLLKRADTGPISVLARVCWPELRGKARRRRESALAWCLAQVDIGQLAPDRLAEALAAAGGIDTIHTLWRKDRDQLLYTAPGMLQAAPSNARQG